MNLSPFQEEMCVLIKDHKITNIHEFLQTNKFFGDIKSESNILIGLSFSINPLKGLTKDDKEKLNSLAKTIKVQVNIKTKIIIEKLQEFVSLWNILEINDLVISNYSLVKVSIRVPDDTNEALLTELTEFTISFDSVLDYNDYFKKNIIPLQALNDFIDNNYRTAKEVESDRNNTKTLFAIWISSILAAGTLIVSITSLCKSPELQPVRIINLDSIVKTTVIPKLMDSLSRAPSPRDTSLSRAEKNIGK